MNTVPAFGPDRVMTEAEYLAFEDASRTKHEFVDGHVYEWPGYEYDLHGQAGATRAHNRLQVNVLTALAPAALAAGCEVYGSDMRLRIADAVGALAEPHALAGATTAATVRVEADPGAITRAPTSNPAASG